LHGPHQLLGSLPVPVGYYYLSTPAPTVATEKQDLEKNNK
jgi:hypothetical protein